VVVNGVFLILVKSYACYSTNV